MPGVIGRRAVLLVIASTLAVAAACDDYPRDPKNTLDRARGDTLRVGVSTAEPWVTGTDGEPGGLEADLVRGFAESIDADVEWVWGPQEEHLEALAKYELDVVAAGLVASTPWSSHLGLTRPYTKERWVVGVPPERSLPDDLEGVEIAVPDAGPAAAWVKDAGARPVRLHDLARASGPVAAPEWKIREIGYRPTGRTLHTVRRVLAAPPGENGLIVHLERHLHETRQRGEVPVSP